MRKYAKLIFSVSYFLMVAGIVTVSITVIDKREGIPSFKSPSFSAEEIAQEIPDGVHWILIDKDGLRFRLGRILPEHPNCLEAFRLKGIPFPQNHRRHGHPKTTKHSMQDRLKTGGRMTTAESGLCSTRT